MRFRNAIKLKYHRIMSSTDQPLDSAFRFNMTMPGLTSVLRFSKVAGINFGSDFDTAAIVK